MFFFISLILPSISSFHVLCMFSFGVHVDLDTKNIEAPLGTIRAGVGDSSGMPVVFKLVVKLESRSGRANILSTFDRESYWSEILEGQSWSLSNADLHRGHDHAAREPMVDGVVSQVLGF